MAAKMDELVAKINDAGITNEYSQFEVQFTAFPTPLHGTHGRYCTVYMQDGVFYGELVTGLGRSYPSRTKLFETSDIDVAFHAVADVMKDDE